MKLQSSSHIPRFIYYFACFSQATEKPRIPANVGRATKFKNGRRPRHRVIFKTFKVVAAHFRKQGDQDVSWFKESQLTGYRKEEQDNEKQSCSSEFFKFLRRASFFSYQRRVSFNQVSYRVRSIRRSNF